jgi:hypothetical protein
MKSLIPPLIMIGVGVLLTIMAYSPTAQFLIRKIQGPNWFLKSRSFSEADDLSLMVVPLIIGLFFLGAGLVLFVVALL